MFPPLDEIALRLHCIPGRHREVPECHLDVSTTSSNMGIRGEYEWVWEGPGDVPGCRSDVSTTLSNMGIRGEYEWVWEGPGKVPECRSDVSTASNIYFEQLSCALKLK